MQRRALQDVGDGNSTESDGSCGIWLEDQDYYGKHLDAQPVFGRPTCMQLCQRQPGCNAVTLNEYDDVCHMKTLPTDRAYPPVSHPGVATIRLCESQLSPIPPGAPQHGAEAPLGTNVTACMEWVEDVAVEGVDVDGAGVTNEQHKEGCLQRCVAHDACTTALFNYRTKACRALGTEPGTPRRAALDWELLQRCEAGHATECGEWVDGGDLFGHDIPGSGSLTAGRDACMKLCEATEGCNAVTYKIYSDKCWLKEVPEGLTHVRDWASDTYLLCPDQRLIKSDRHWDAKTIAGIAVMTAVGASLLVLICAIFARRRGKRQRKFPDVSTAQDESRNTSMEGALTSVKLESTQHKSGPGSADTSKRAVCTSEAPSTGDLAQAPRVQWLRLAPQRTGAPPNICKRSALSASASNCTGTEIHGDSGRVLVAIPPSRVRAAPVPDRFQGSYATWQACLGSSMRSSVETGITTRPVSTLPVPGATATAEDVRNYLHNQLDRIEAAHNKPGSTEELLDGLKFAGTGPHDRLEGGQAIVQMAHSRMNRVDYAIKFFVSNSAFEQERALYSGSSPLGQFLPQVRNVVNNEGGDVVDPGGHPLPPCIVMERGESLDLWSDRNAPDRAQAFTVIYHIAQRMAEFHAAGFVHRDLKPGNVMWLPRANRWTVIDFGCAARRKRKAPIAYTLRYAAPEVIDAKRGGEAEMVVEEALDAWSLGVMAFEMCVGSTPFPRGMPADAIMDQIQGVGREGLPWEGQRLTAEVQGKLRLFRGALLQLLHRDPRQRPSMAHFCRTCSKMLGDHTE